MKKNLLTLGVLAISFTANAQILTSVGDAGTFYVSEGALVYNGGGVQTKGSGQIDLHGNMMIVGRGTDAVSTKLVDGTTNKLNGSNIVLRLNGVGVSAPTTTSTYGQLFIKGISQGNLKGIVSKEFLADKHGSGDFYQQIAMPFNNKVLNTLSTEFGKTFSTVRYSKNEILKWNNGTVVSDDIGSLTSVTSDPTRYYILGSLNNNLDTSTPPATLPTIAPTATGKVYTLQGEPFADGTIQNTLSYTGPSTFGTNGFGVNSYNEYYNSYLQDQFQVTTHPAWTNEYGKNIYQFGNPFFTNLDLSRIGYVESGAINDGNDIGNIWGVRYSPGTVITLSSGSTYSVGASIQTFKPSTDVNAGKPLGDTGLIIKPMQTFVLKLRDATSKVLKFDDLRRFQSTARQEGTSYAVTANKNGNNTLKQLGVIALDASGAEIGRTYYVVSASSLTGHQNDNANTVQAASGAGVIKTFEEDPINGMYDYNYTTKYALYINEANEVNFLGKPVPLAIYSADVKSLKFELKENAELLPNAQQDLSSGVAFYYKTASGNTAAIGQNMVIPTNGSSEFGLSYGPITTAVLGTSESVKNNRTLVVYNEAIDNYVVQFDPKWKSADIQVFDMSGKLVISAKNVKTSQDFVINLSNKIQGTYIVTGVNENGEKFTSKIIR